ncbi:MAG TPA: HD domain-containing phosphohydrolase, partial [Longimicrobiales bacterium]
RLAALTQQNLGTLATIRGDFDVALEHGQNALSIFRELSDDLAAARVLNNIGMLQVDTRQLGHAELSFRSAFTLAERNDDAGLRVIVQTNRAELALVRQDYESAHNFCAEAFQAYTHLGSESGLSEVYRLYGMLYRDTGNAELASTHFLLSIKLAHTCGDLLLEAEAERERAQLEMQQGRHREALSALSVAHRQFQALQARREVANIERKLEHIERMYLRVVEMLESEITLSFDEAAIEQYRRVSRYASQLARIAGFSGRDLTWLRIGSFLYDIGKRSVPARVLNKRGPLDSSEWALIKGHVLESERIVSELDPPWEMRPMVRHHHEHWDGTGYPDGLRGADIPLTARLLCIVDAFTALTSRRAHRGKLAENAALQVMAAEAGTTFDPDLFEAFRSLVEGDHAAA